MQELEEIYAWKHKTYWNKQRLHWVRKEKRTACSTVKGTTSLIVETLSEASFGLTRWGEVKQNGDGTVSNMGRNNGVLAKLSILRLLLVKAEPWKGV